MKKKSTVHKTRYASFRRDRNGTWHYNLSRTFRAPDAYGAAADAIRHRPNGAAWFWFNDKCCPMINGDTSATLSTRLFEWINAENANALFGYYKAFALAKK